MENNQPNVKQLTEKFEEFFSLSNNKNNLKENQQKLHSIMQQSLQRSKSLKRLNSYNNNIKRNSVDIRDSRNNPYLLEQIQQAEEVLNSITETDEKDIELNEIKVNPNVNNTEAVIDDLSISKNLNDYEKRIPLSRFTTINGEWSSDMIDSVNKFKEVMEEDLKIYKRMHKIYNRIIYSIRVIYGLIGAVSVYLPVSNLDESSLRTWNLVAGGTLTFLTTVISKPEIAKNSAFYKERYKQTQKMIEYLNHQNRKQTLDPDIVFESIYNMRLKLLEDE
jgi:hypothetical protein